MRAILVAMVGLLQPTLPADQPQVDNHNIAQVYVAAIEPLLRVYRNCLAECDFPEEIDGRVVPRRLVFRASNGRRRLDRAYPPGNDKSDAFESIEARIVGIESAFVVQNTRRQTWFVRELAENLGGAEELARDIRSIGAPFFAHTCDQGLPLTEYFRDLDVKSVTTGEAAGLDLVTVLLEPSARLMASLSAGDYIVNRNVTLTLLPEHHFALHSIVKERVWRDAARKELQDVTAVHVEYAPNSLSEKGSVPVIQRVIYERKDEFGKTVSSRTATMKFIDFSPNWVGNEFQLEGFQLETPRQHTAFSKTYYLSILAFLALALIGGWLLRRHSDVQIAASAGSVSAGDNDRTGPPGNPPLDGTGGEPAL